LLQRGTFRPVTLTNEKILDNGIKQCERDLKLKSSELIIMMEITMSQLKDGGDVDKKDFLDRVDTLCAMGHHVLISNFPLFAQLKVELRKFTDNYICMVIGATALEGLFDKNFYQKYPGGMLAAFGHLFDDLTRLYVYPFKSDTSCTTAASFHPATDVSHFYQHLMQNKYILDMQDCDHVDTSLHSEQIRKLLAAGNPKWEELVPTKVRDLIKKRKLFGFNS
jgi:hypothetical protein